MQTENQNNLAEKIALILQSAQSENEDSIKVSLEKINQRLKQIESKIFDDDKALIKLKSGLFHPSQDKFSELEELAVEVSSGLENEKACPFEPTGKPCDRCSMCDTRGF